MQQHLYFIGLDHPTLAGLAVACKKLGFAASGSGFNINQLLADHLAQAGIHFHTRYAASHLPPDSIVVVSPHIDRNNPELQAAIKAEQEIVSTPQLVQQLTQSQQRIVVLGSAQAPSLVATTLRQADQPVDLIGSQILQSAVHRPQPLAVDFSARPLVVIEADLEPSSSLDNAAKALYYQPHLLIIIAPQDDYKQPLAYYKNLQHLLQDMAEQSSDQLDTRVLLVGHDAKTKELLIKSGLPYQMVGQHQSYDWQAKAVELLPQKTVFWLFNQQKQIDMVTLQEPGRQYLLASLAAIATAKVYHIELDQALLGLAQEPGWQLHQHLTNLRQDASLGQIILDPRFADDIQYHLPALLQSKHAAPEHRCWLVTTDEAINLLKKTSNLTKALADIDIVIILNEDKTSPNLKAVATGQRLAYAQSRVDALHFIRKNLGSADMIVLVTPIDQAAHHDQLVVNELK